MLEVAAVPAVGRGEVGLVEQPSVVRRHPVLDREDHAAEVRAGHPDALLRQAGPQRVEGREPRDQRVRHRQGGVGLGDPGVVVVGGRLGRWHRRVDLPGEGRAEGRVLGEEVVEDRRARAGLPDDDDRRHDLAVGHLGVGGAPRGDPGPGREVARELGRHHLHAQLVEAGLLDERGDQPVEPLLPGRLAEVVGAGGRPRLLDEAIAIEPLPHVHGPHRRSRHEAGCLLSVTLS